MPGCSAVGCKNRSERKLPGVSFHRFPKESVLRAAWIVACRRKNWLPSATSVLCSEHFSEDLIDRTSLSIVRLRENAIPNIFNGSSKKSSLQKISEKCKFPRKHLTSTPITDFFSDEETQSCDERTSETTEECGGIETAVCLNSPENESSGDYVLPVPILENCKSSEKRLAFKAAVAFVKEVVQSSDESTSETPIIHNLRKPAVCLNSPVNESSVENRPPVQIPEIYRSPEKRLLSTVTKTFLHNEIIQSSDRSINKTPAKCDVIRTTACLNSPINESSVENRPPVQIPKKQKFPEKCLTSTTGTALSDNEVNESSDENVSEASTEYGMMEPIVCLNSDESDVEIPVQENDSELYPTEDIETINLKRKLAESNNLVSKYRKKIKVLQQQNRRWKKRLEDAKHSLSVLQRANKSLFL